MSGSSRPWAWPSGALALLLLGAACSGGDGDSAAPTPADAVTEGCGPAEPALDSRASTHVVDPDAVDYDLSPPAAGPHFGGNPPEPGVYDRPLEYAHQVLAVEVGMVVVNYDPIIGAADAARLETLADGQTHVIVTPAPAPIDGGATVALTAWELRRLCSEVSDDVLEEARAFIAEHVDTTRAEGAGPPPG